MSDKGRQLFEQLMRFKPEGLTANAWAVKAGVGRNVWNDLQRHGNPSRRTLEKLLAAADSSLAEFEALRVAGSAAPAPRRQAAVSEDGPAWRPGSTAPLPVVATEAAGGWREPTGPIELVRIRPSEVVARMPQPLSLTADADAYAVTVIGDSMWPRFRPGRRLAVSPAAPVAIGDDVLVLLRGGALDGDGGHALIKELVRRSAGLLELRQFNPGVTFAVPTSEVEAVHKIVGELI